MCSTAFLLTCIVKRGRASEIFVEVEPVLHCKTSKFRNISVIVDVLGVSGLVDEQLLEKKVEMGWNKLKRRLKQVGMGRSRLKWAGTG